MSQGCPEERAQPLLRHSLQAASLRPRPAVLLTEKGPQGLACKAGTWVLSSAVPPCDLGGRERGGPFPSPHLSLVVHRRPCLW